MRTQITISISLPPEMAEKLDKISKSNGMSRSSFVKYAVAGQLRQEQAFENIPEIVQALKKLGEEKRNERNDNPSGHIEENK